MSTIYCSCGSVEWVLFSSCSGNDLRLEGRSLMATLDDYSDPSANHGHDPRTRIVGGGSGKKNRGSPDAPWLSAFSFSFSFLFIIAIWYVNVRIWSTVAPIIRIWVHVLGLDLRKREREREGESKRSGYREIYILSWLCFLRSSRKVYMEMTPLLQFHVVVFNVWRYHRYGAYQRCTFLNFENEMCCSLFLA